MRPVRKSQNRNWKKTALGISLVVILAFGIPLVIFTLGSGTKISEAPVPNGEPSSHSQQHIVSSHAQTSGTPAIQPSGLGSNNAGGTNAAIVSREMDIKVNPYAAALREPGKSKRAWDPGYLQSVASLTPGDSIGFELTGGIMASGFVKIVQKDAEGLKYISGNLTAPESGEFFFVRQAPGGRAGVAVGVIQFAGSSTAYRIEPTGEGGAPELWRRHLDEVICVGMEPLKSEEGEAVEAPPLRPDLVPEYIPTYNSNIVSLQSLPGARGVLLLDFFGGYTESWGGVKYAAPQVSNAQIRDIWKRVAEDYMPLNINVTTDLKVFEAAPETSRQRCVFSPDAPTVAGVAFFGSWNWSGDTVCWSKYYVGKSAAEVAAHEAGHTVGLAHQTQAPPGEPFVNYYSGHSGPGNTGWAPIMGAGYNQPVTTWAKGEYLYAAEQQDELATMVTYNDVNFRADDTGSTLATSRYLEAYSNNTVSAEGVIETTGDSDAYRFSTAGGNVSISANVVGDWANLAILAMLVNSNGVVIASNNPQVSLSAAITTNLSAGTYAFNVTGAGRNSPITNGFSAYGSLGYYSITGTVANVVLPSRLMLAENSPNGTVVGTVTATNLGTDMLRYAITSGNTGNTFALSDAGLLTVASSNLLNYEVLGSNSQQTVQFEMLVNITNLSNPSLTELSRRVVVQILDLNEAPSIFGFTNILIAHTQPGTIAVTMQTSDPDHSTILNLAIISGNNNDMFVLDDSGDIIVAGDLNPTIQSVYNLAVRAVDNGAPALSATNYVQISVTTNASPYAPGSISYALYDNITGTTLNNLTGNPRFPTDPTSESQRLSLEGLINRADNYGAVMRGYLIPPVSGNYTFYIATDDNGELYLSSSTNPANMTLIAYISGAGNYAASRQWNKYASQKSPVRTLVGGQAYYIEARLKEGTGNDNLAVGWTGPIGTETNVIPALYLAPYFVNYVPHLAGFTNFVRRDAFQGARLGRMVVTDVNSNDLHTLSIISGNGAGIFGLDSDGWIYVANEAALAATVTTNFLLSVLVTDNGVPALSAINTAKITLAEASGLAGAAIQQEKFTNIAGIVVSDLASNSKYPARPDALVALTSFASPLDVGDDFGSRIRAMLVPSVSGDYRFYISSDDASELLFSRTTNASDAVVIASVPGYAGQNVWTKYAEQTSAVITNLVAGQQYYIEARHKEGDGSDHVEVAWLVPGSGVTSVIPGANLQPVDLNYPPAITNQTLTVFSGATNGTVVGVIAATDSTLDHLTFKLTGGNTGGTFALDPATGQISVADNTLISSGNALFSLNVTVQDSGYGGVYPLRTNSAVVTIYTLSGGGIVWDGIGGNVGAQDGSGVWGIIQPNWWTGYTNVPWNDGIVAYFGVNTATNCMVTLANDVTPAGIVFNATGGAYTLGNGGGGIDIHSSLAVTVSNAATISAVVKGAGVLNKTGNGTLTLAALNTLSGGITVSNGALVLAGGTPFNGGAGSMGPGPLTVNSGAVVSNGIHFAIGGVSGNQTVNLNGGTFTSSYAEYFKTINMTAGTLNINETGGDRFRGVGSGGVINTVGSSSVSTIASSTGIGFATDIGALTFNVAAGSVPNGVDLAVSAPISAGGNTVTKTGAGMMTLSAANGFTGALVVSNGTLKLDGSALGSSTPILSASTRITNHSCVVFNRNAPGYTPIYSLSGAGDYFVDGVGGGNQHDYRIILRGTASDNTGTIWVTNNGKLWLDVAGANAIGDSSVVDVGPTAKFYIYQGISETIGGLAGTGSVFGGDAAGTSSLTVGGGNRSATFGGVIQNNSGTFTLNKMGSGTQTLSGANIYTGPTTVNGGALIVDGSLASGSVVTVANATLGGVGTINGPITMQAGSILAPGAAGIGALTVNNTLTLNTAGNCFFRISKTGGFATNDSVKGLTGTLTYQGALTVTNVTSDANQLVAGDSFKLFSKASGGYSGSFATTNLPLLSPGLLWVWTPTNGTLAVVAEEVLPPVINAVALGNQGQFIMTFSGPSGQTYKLTGTNVLIAPPGMWPVLSTGTFAVNPVAFTNSAPTNAVMFYRVVSP